MFHIDFKRYSNAVGSTLLSVLAFSSLLMVSLFIVFQFMSSHTRRTRSTRNLTVAQTEHDALKQLISSMASQELTSILCSAPHPYQKFNAEAGRCDRGKDPTNTEYDATRPTATELTNYNLLADKYFELVNTSVTVQTPHGSHTGFVLDASTYSSQILPLITAAGCLGCHDGTKVGLTRDFRVFTSVTTPTTLISTKGFGTAFARMLLKPQINLPSMMLQPDMGHQVTFSRSLTGQCAPANRVERTLVTPDINLANCPDNCFVGLPPCNTGEYPDCQTCNQYCTSFAVPPNSETPAQCLSYTRKQDCLVPTVKCSDPPTCPSGTSIPSGGCQENQLGSECGVGATVWRCVIPSDPSEPTATRVQFSILSTFPGETPGAVKTLFSHGTLQ